MYRNIINFFSFHFITQNVRTGKVREGQRQLKCTHRGRGMNLWWNLFWCRSKSFWLYNIPNTNANSWGHTSSLRPTRCTWSQFLLACHPRNLLGISTENTYMRPVYFRCQAHFLLFTDVKGDFKSISNTNASIQKRVKESRTRMSH